jgi:hypothetical protein
MVPLILLLVLASFMLVAVLVAQAGEQLAQQEQGVVGLVEITRQVQTPQGTVLVAVEVLQYLVELKWVETAARAS